MEELMFVLFLVIVLYVPSSALVALIGLNRKIGYQRIYLLSLLFSPIIGAIIALCSKKKELENLREYFPEEIEEFMRTLPDPQNSVFIPKQEFQGIAQKYGLIIDYLSRHKTAEITTNTQDCVVIEWPKAIVAIEYNQSSYIY